jgi:hypothetical protein
LICEAFGLNKDGVTMEREGSDWLLRWEMAHADCNLDFLRPKYLPPREG